MESLDHDSFLTRLEALFESSQEHGSIWLTHKRLRYEDEDVAMGHTTGGSGVDEREYPCLIRVTDGGTARFSTRVLSSELSKFHTAYGNLLKSAFSMTLRKRDKKKEKLKVEQAAKRKKKMTEQVAIVEGPKRGNGRRKRQRKVKALKKQLISQQKAKEREEASAARGLEHTDFALLSLYVLKNAR
ncbi:hypothetical protein MIND_00371100 [Mycena indigotica]|uniref:Signal recognition particle subunit SRP14 n=1 Tax=Mycena indigotica TaxID=2126181 RepID=A0A8H6T2W5_9AGAR|nr:uncharacterized protein MIND_00371100 [Mycena indigotica]KAF7309983.1 hypothetical protein MIND_00371100 [Mycena indigotica]